MAAKRKFSKRYIKILALQRAARMLAMCNQHDLFMPDMPHDEYPYKTEIMLEVLYIEGQLRQRLAKLSMKEWPLDVN